MSGARGWEAQTQVKIRQVELLKTLFLLIKANAPHSPSIHPLLIPN